jgi:hypothetical protein
MKNNFLNITIGFLILLILPFALQAQDQRADRFSFNFKGEPLAQALETVARETGIDMVYDPKIVQGIEVYQRIRRESVPNILNRILKGSPLDFVTLSSGTVVIVETVREPVSYGSYNGKVIDRQTGEALPGASVMFANASGGTSAGPSGTFSLPRLVTGTYTIIFSYVGYEAVSKTIQINPNRGLREKIVLKPKPVDFTPIVITGHQPQLPNTASVSPNSEWEPVGPMQDPIRSLSLFSGVQHGLSMTGLHLQGGREGEHRILLDGVPVYNPYSFGQMFSAFSPYAIGKVELHKAGYGVAEGSQISGLVNLEHDLGGVERNRLTFQADPLSVNLRGDLYIPGDDESSLKVMAAARSNYWDIYEEPRLNNILNDWDQLDPLVTGLLIDSDEDPSLYRPREHRADVRFYDVHLASRYQINDYKSLSSSFYAGKNEVSTGLLREAAPEFDLPRYFYARDKYKYQNFMGRLAYQQEISPRFNWRSRASISLNKLRHRYLIGTSDNAGIPNLSNGSNLAFDSFQTLSVQQGLPDQRNTNRIRHIILRTDGTYHFSPAFELEGGLQADLVTSGVDLNDLFYLPTLSEQQSAFYSSYLNGTMRTGDYWKFTLGNRLTYENTSRQFYAEPRAGIQYDRPESDIGSWSARLAGGLYRQFVNQYEITNPGPTSLIPSLSVWSHAGTSKKPKAWHLSGSFRLEPTRSTTLNLEAFYKWQPTTYRLSYDNLLEGVAENRSSFDAFAEATKMETFGTGLRLNQSLLESKLQFLAGYDFSYNRIDLDRQFGRTLPAPWNEPHRLQFRTLWKIVPQFTAVAKWQSIYGRSWGFRQSYYNYLFFQERGAFGDYSFGTPENDRLSPFHQLDLSFIYQPSLNFTDLEMRMDLINVMDRRNTIDWSLQQPRSGGSETDRPYEINKRTMPGFYPSVSVRLRF